MAFSRVLIILLTLTLFATLVFDCQAYEVGSELDVVSAIDRAEFALASAYDAVLDAEHNGENVLNLLAKLNIGGEYLTNARIWWSLGEFENSTRFATLCYDVAEEVRNEATKAENAAYGLWVQNLWLRMLVSIICMVFVVLLSSLAWRTFKRHYYRRVLKMKVERP